MLISSMLYLVAETQSSGGGSGGSSIVSAIIGGTVGAFITAIISLTNTQSTLQAQRRITELTLEAQSEINELNAGWQAQREADEAERKAVHEKEVWKRTRKEELYAEYILTNESIIQKKFAGASKDHREFLVSAFDTVINPTLIVISSKEVFDAVTKVRQNYMDFLEERSKISDNLFDGGETEKSTALFNQYTKSAREAMNAMREDLGIEKLYEMQPNSE